MIEADPVPSLVTVPSVATVATLTSEDDHVMVVPLTVLPVESTATADSCED